MKIRIEYFRFATKQALYIYYFLFIIFFSILYIAACYTRCTPSRKLANQFAKVAPPRRLPSAGRLPPLSRQIAAEKGTRAAARFQLPMAPILAEIVKGCLLILPHHHTSLELVGTPVHSPACCVLPPPLTGLAALVSHGRNMLGLHGSPVSYCWLPPFVPTVICFNLSFQSR